MIYSFNRGTNPLLNVLHVLGAFIPLRLSARGRFETGSHPN